MNGEEDSRNREGSASFFFMDCGLSCRGPVRVSDGTGFGPTALSSDAVRACPGYRKAGHVPDSEYRVCVLSVSGFASSPFGAEWMRFDEECGMHELIQTVPHIAFVVEDLDFELATRGFTILTKPNPPSEGVRVAMIEHNGVPIELIEFSS